MSATPARVAVAGLLLAAGGGSRLGRPKALVTYRGRTLAELGVALLRDGGCDPVVVVSGAAPIELPDARVVHNPDWPTGMGSSLRAGLAALPAEAGAVVVALVDQPSVRAEAVARLLAAYRAGAVIAVASYGGRLRNPVLLARSCWADVAVSAVGDVGARPYLRAHPELVTEVPCDDVGTPADIDTPEDLAALEGRGQA